MSKKQMYCASILPELGFTAVGLFTNYADAAMKFVADNNLEVGTTFFIATGEDQPVDTLHPAAFLRMLGDSYGMHPARAIKLHSFLDDSSKKEVIEAWANKHAENWGAMLTDISDLMDLPIVWNCTRCKAFSVVALTPEVVLDCDAQSILVQNLESYVPKLSTSVSAPAPVVMPAIQVADNDGVINVPYDDEDSYDEDDYDDSDDDDDDDEDRDGDYDSNEEY